MNFLAQPISQLSAGPVALAPESAQWIDTCIRTALTFDKEVIGKMALQNMVASNDDDDYWPQEGSWLCSYRPYNVKEGILTIPVCGVLLNNFTYSTGWATGYQYIARALLRGMEDFDVKGVAFVINSPGGDASGNFDLVDMIYNQRGKKPMASFVSDYAYSGGYSIASAADEITVTRTGGVGSIGVVMWHFDYSKYMEEAGVKITPIFSGKHKVDGNPYQALPESVKNRMQARSDNLRDLFVSTVSRNLGVDEKVIRDTEALTYGADEAVQLGLAQKVSSLDESMASFAVKLAKTYGETMMAGEDKIDSKVSEAAVNAARDEGKAAGVTEGKATGVTEGAASANTRWAAIVGSDAAKTRMTAAVRLAKTAMSAEEAVSLLGDLPEEKASGKSGFEQVMDNSEHPNVTSAVDANGAQMTDAQKIVADFRNTTGAKASKQH